MADFDTFTRAYLDCMLWAESPTESDTSCTDLGFDVDDIDPAGLAEIVADCKAFQADHWDDFCNDRTREDCVSRAGHDFYLTRNRHGAGFWDGDWPEDIGRKLTEASHAYGTQGLTCADGDGNGPLYVHG